MIILAFPGTGKTYLAKRKGGFVDLDFDHFRRANVDVELSQEQLLSMYAGVAKRYAKEGMVVMLNEPCVLEETDLHVDRMYLPGCDHMRNNSAIKLGVRPAKIDEWVADWICHAAASKVPVIHMTGPLVHYLRGNRM